MCVCVGTYRMGKAQEGGRELVFIEYLLYMDTMLSIKKFLQEQLVNLTKCSDQSRLPSPKSHSLHFLWTYREMFCQHVSRVQV